MIRVTILGRASAKPTAGSHPSAQAVNVNEQYFLVDAGEGVQQQMLRCGINALKLRAVFISHLHGDHLFGLFPLISTLGLYGRRTPLQVFAPHPFGEILEYAKAADGDFLEKLKCYMMNFSGYIEQSSVRLAQEWVKNVVTPAQTGENPDAGKLSSDLSDVSELLSFGVRQGMLKPDTPVPQLAHGLVDLLYGIIDPRIRMN